MSVNCRAIQTAASPLHRIRKNPTSKTRPRRITKVRFLRVTAGVCPVSRSNIIKSAPNPMTHAARVGARASPIFTWRRTFTIIPLALSSGTQTKATPSANTRQRKARAQCALRIGKTLDIGSSRILAPHSRAKLHYSDAAFINSPAAAKSPSTNA